MGVDGRLHRPLTEARGRPVVFLFISHDCPVCNTYAPEIARIEARYKGRVAIAIVYSEARLSRDGARKHAREYSISNATLLLDSNSEFAAACDAHFTPQAVVFDSKGRIAYSGRIDDRYLALGRQLPTATTHDLTLALDAVLAHRPATPASGPPVGCLIILPHKT